MQKIQDQFNLILDGRCSDPFSILGAHPDGKNKTLIRAFLPGAIKALVLAGNKEIEMKEAIVGGLFEANVKGTLTCVDYQLKTHYTDGAEHTTHDPYAFTPVLTDFDLHLMGEGTHYNKYDRLGAHVIEQSGISGVNFALWAPNAQGISVVGDFNFWDGRRHPMRSRGTSGIWELFIPDLKEGDLYKFELRTPAGVLLKADPYGFFSELRPMTASVVWDMNKYEWLDKKWMEERPKKDWLSSPINTYEVHLGSWQLKEDGGFLSFRDLAHRLVDYVKAQGYTHIEVLPVQEHPFDGSWGYQVLGYFAVTSRFGTPEDFMYFVDHCHQNNIGVIMDWVPAHFPKDAHGLAHFDGTYLYEHEHPNMREHMDWGTLIFNYGRREVASFLLNSALFWLNKYHIDGLRVDAVASMLYLDYSREDGQWIPNEFGGNENIAAVEFIKRFNELCHRDYPGVLTIAEESTAWAQVSRPTYTGGLGFSLKWNMGWMHDILEYFTKEPVHRKYHQHLLTFGLIYAFHENFVLVLSHDEVVHGKGSLIGKMPGDIWQKFANLRLMYGFMYAHPGKKMLFMGAEIGQFSEWDADACLEWDLLKHDPHKKLQHYMSDLNHMVSKEPALHEMDFDPDGFEWIDFKDADSSVIAFIRKGKDPRDFIVFVFNFTPLPRSDYRIGLPEAGVYKEIINSDSSNYWGSNVGNSGEVRAEETPFNQWPCSMGLSLPPLGMVALKLIEPDE